MNPYQGVYLYDAGGNRKLKIDGYNPQRVEYHYDVDADANPALYGSKNNRLMYAELYNTDTGALLSTTYYEYSGDGNVTRVITEVPSAVVMESMAANTGDPDLGGADGGGMAMMAGSGGASYSAVRFGYAANGQAVVFAHDESWTGSDGCPTNYTITWAREFRYDGARARYMDRPLNVGTLGPNPQPHPTQPTTWSDYDGDEIYGDFEMVSGSPLNKRSFEPGIGRTENPLTTPVTNYYHGDMLGTTRLMSNPGGSSMEPAVYTAFGERISGPTITDATRYGYVGAWGYEQNADFPFLHVGARYYDPSSGRFLERDPIGILGGLNVYAYVVSGLTNAVDPSGLTTWKEIKQKIKDILEAIKEAAKRLVPGGELPGALECAPGATRADLEDAKRRHIYKDHPDDPADPNCPRCKEIDDALHPPKKPNSKPAR